MTFDIARAWKDEEYRKSLSEEQLSALPESPVGSFELTDQDLAIVSGAHGHHHHSGSKGGDEINLSIFGLINLCFVSAVVALCTAEIDA